MTAGAQVRGDRDFILKGPTLGPRAKAVILIGAWARHVCRSWSLLERGWGLTLGIDLFENIAEAGG